MSNDQCTMINDQARGKIVDIDHSQDITVRLKAWTQGDARALESILPLVYDELHRTAHVYMAREAPDNTLQTTALVNEVYLRLSGAQSVGWNGRAHFFAMCATLRSEER